MRGCDASGVECRPRNEKVYDCMFLYELGRWRRYSGFVSVYVLYASWTGCAALGGLLMIENDWAVSKSELACSWEQYTLMVICN